MRFSKDVVAAAMALAVGACAQVGQLPATAAIEKPDDAYFVIGVQPETATILLVDGSVEGGQFERLDDVFGPLLVPFSGPPKDGYVVGKAQPGHNTLAISQIGLEQSYAPCNGARTVVFDVAPGSIVYVTDVRYTPNPAGTTMGQAALIPAYHQDIDGARAYLRSHYPKLADKLQMARKQMLPIRNPGSC
jgi:hypothetical protein